MYLRTIDVYVTDNARGTQSMFRVGIRKAATSSTSKKSGVKKTNSAKKRVRNTEKFRDTAEHKDKPAITWKTIFAHVSP